MKEEVIFHQALEVIDPVERAAFLDRACRDDPSLRASVDALLRANAGARGFLEKPPSPAVASAEGQPMDRRGSLLGPYKLIEPIGEGGMGAVWMAQQLAPVRRLVAIKLIKAGMDSRQVIARFEAERQALALMDHPHIAKVLDAGTTSAGRPYFVMDLVKGLPITRYCDEHRLTPRQRLELFVPVCQAIQHAHQKGIIHRDLKPSNVLVALYDGRPVPKVIDFGVAKAAGHQLTEKTLVTGFGAIVGTLEYMSPEQAELNQLDIDTRSDIYSLGVLLYELLAGVPPFSRQELQQAGMLEILRAIREQEPSTPSARLSTSEGLPTLAANRGTEPSKLAKLVRGELDWIVMKALEKDRNRRYETANGLALDVQRYLNDEAVLACPPSAAYLFHKLARRNKAALATAAMVAAALVAGIIGTTWGMIRATGAQNVAVNEANQKTAALRAARRSERAAKEQLFLALWSQARASRFSRQPGQRLDSLDALERAARIRPDERLRDEAMAAMAVPDIRRVPVRRSILSDAVAVAFGARRRICASANRHGVISIRELSQDREMLRIASSDLTVTTLVFSPDDEFLVGKAEGNELRCWRVADGKSMFADSLRGCQSHAFSADGRKLAVGRRDQLHCLDPATGEEVAGWKLPERAHAIAFSPDGRKLAVGFVDSKFVSVFDAATGTTTSRLSVGAITNQVIAWHPDGVRLAVSGSDPRIQIWNVAEIRKIATLEGHAQNVTELAFHPQGGLLATHSWDGSLRLWEPSTGRPLLQLPLTRLDIHPPLVANGRVLGTTSHGEQHELLEVTPSPEYRTLVSSAGAGTDKYNLGDISADGRLLVVGMDSGARVWDIASGRELVALPPWTIYVAFEDSAGAEGSSRSPRALLTGGAAGLLRWPITFGNSDTNGLQLHPPERLSSAKRSWFSRSASGRTLVSLVEAEGAVNQIVSSDAWATPRALGAHPLGEVKALSADGKWAASCGWHSDQVRLWDVGAGKKVRSWDTGRQTLVFFSPDSRALIISRGDEFTFWDLKTFQLLRRLPRNISHYPGHVAFSPDGKLMALEMAPGVIHLMDSATGRTVAKIGDPHGDRAHWQGFTPDGAQLIVVARAASAVHIWDLRAMRQRLKQMNLDWDWPQLPASTLADKRGEVLVELVVQTPTTGKGAGGASSLIEQARAPAGGNNGERAIAAHRRALAVDPRNWWLQHRIGNSLLEQGELEEAVAAYKEALGLKPDYTPGQESLVNVAWRLVAWADGDASTLEQATELAQHVIALNPNLELLARCAPMLLLTDDIPEYRQVVARLIADYGDAKEPRTAYLTARLCALAPDATPNSAAVLELAERAVRASPEPHHLHTLGLAEYRAGHYDEAIATLHKSIEGKWSAVPANWLVLALAHHRLGRADEARKWFDKTARWIESTGVESTSETSYGLLQLHGHDALACMVLMREAQAVLRIAREPEIDDDKPPGEGEANGPAKDQ